VPWHRPLAAGVEDADAGKIEMHVGVGPEAAGRHQLAVQLEQARQEIALLREELDIKDGRWTRSRTRRRPHYRPTQRLRILQLRAARGWTLEKTASVFLLDLHALQLWIRRVDEHGARELIETPNPSIAIPSSSDISCGSSSACFRRWVASASLASWREPSSF